MNKTRFDRQFMQTIILFHHNSLYYDYLLFLLHVLFYSIRTICITIIFIILIIFVLRLLPLSLDQVTYDILIIINF